MWQYTCQIWRFNSFMAWIISCISNIFFIIRWFSTFARVILILDDFVSIFIVWHLDKDRLETFLPSASFSFQDRLSIFYKTRLTLGRTSTFWADLCKTIDDQKDWTSRFWSWAFKLIALLEINTLFSSTTFEYINRRILSVVHGDLELR